MSVAVVIPAAGAGRRMGNVPKAFLTVAGHPLLWHTLQPFLRSDRVVDMVLALPPAEAALPPAWLLEIDTRIRIVRGGDERGDSVYAALRALGAEIETVLVHDAARPLVSSRVIGESIAAAETGRCVAVGVPVADTIQEVDEAGMIIGTPPRARLWQAQTPQAFPRQRILEAYDRAARDGVRATDEAALVRRYGGTVYMIEGERDNLKVTTPADLWLVETILRQQS